jgi:hypothetical protein
MRWLATLAALLLALPAAAQDCKGPAGICTTARPGAFPLVADGKTAAIQYDAGDEPGVADAITAVTADFGKVGGGAGTRSQDDPMPIIVGTIGRSALIDGLIADGKLDVSGIRGKWEGFVQVVIDSPEERVDRALVIAGADRRGTIFGLYDLSRRMGVSPWNWWADVPVRQHKSLYVLPGARVEMPKVKYRGIFLNDEEPALGNWARTTFGGLNAKFYARVFELTLRLKGNYLWPAMWGKSLWDDDPRSAELASRMGIVLGTSHHEPMVRAHVEWERYGQKTPWDYTKNPERLRDFWRDGIKRNAGREALVTVGMRGDGDEPMTEGTATALLERIVADQRKIIADVTGKPAAETPQVWALYKEVQDYYDKGMRVPDDVTLLFADDNWGNIRRLPQPQNKDSGDKRAGGYGVYYHFDYVGGPRNYKWLNVTQIARVWEQMSLAHAHGADQLWIVNVGDLKPMELPTSFFLDMAWNPDAMPLEAMVSYHRDWAAEQFGPEHAAAIGEVMDLTTRYLARRKPELLDAKTYDLVTEWPKVVAEWSDLEKTAEAIAPRLPKEAQDAYYQLVLHPVQAGANLHRLYHAAALNNWYAKQHQPQALEYANRVEALFAKDKEISKRYEATAGGKWPHMMSQTHIGYTNWQQPEQDVLPELVRPAGISAKGAFFPHPPRVPERTTTYQMRGAFLETNGAIAFDAKDFTLATPAGGAEWRVIPGLGRTGSAVTPWPQTAPSVEPKDGARLDYDIWIDQPGEFNVTVIASPSLDVMGGRGLRYAVSQGDGPANVVDIWAGTNERDWGQAVAKGARITTTKLKFMTAGRHRFRLWMIDPGMVVQRIILDRGALPETYLGPPDSPKGK